LRTRASGSAFLRTSDSHLFCVKPKPAPSPVTQSVAVTRRAESLLYEECFTIGRARHRVRIVSHLVPQHSAAVVERRESLEEWVEVFSIRGREMCTPGGLSSRSDVRTKVVPERERVYFRRDRDALVEQAVFFHA
jgi:hypothetical protein